MNTYKLTPLMMLLASLSMTGSYANYTIVYPLDNIKFTNTPVVQEEWSDGDPIVSEWVLGGKECSNWAPAENTKSIGVSYQQTSNDCSIEKTRTVQKTEVSNLGNHRNLGELVTEKESDKNLTNTLINYEMTVNGVTCPFTYNDSSLPSTNTIMIAHCPFLKSLDGQTVKVDISPKQ